MITAEDLSVRLTIWLALAAYTSSEILRVKRPSIPPGSAARRLFVFSAAAYLGHVIAAFHLHHEWSHASAVAETARQTREMVGWNWGGGVYVNYAFTVLWWAEALWWTISERTYLGRAKGLHFAIKGIFLFMILNGAVVFVNGWPRLAGTGLVLVLAGLMLREWNGRRSALDVTDRSRCR